MESIVGWCFYVYKDYLEWYVVFEGNIIYYNELLCNVINYDMEKYNWVNDFCFIDYFWMVVFGLVLFVIVFVLGLFGCFLFIYFLFNICLFFVL